VLSPTGRHPAAAAVILFARATLAPTLFRRHTASPSSRPEGSQRMTSRVLVVDDEPAIRHAVGRVLRREGMDVVTVATAGEALAALDTAPAHAVLLDYHLPGMSGAALGAEIVTRWPALSGRLVFVSGDPLLTAEALPPACRGARLMPKPFDLAELVAVVRALLIAPAAGPSSSETAP